MNSQFKRIITVLMLLLYGFIITPVALWHSHACDSSSQCITKPPASEKQVSKAGHSCQVCDHAYSSFLSGHESQEETYLNQYPPYGGRYNKGIPVLFFLQCNTRGSPAA